MCDLLGWTPRYSWREIPSWKSHHSPREDLQAAHVISTVLGIDLLTCSVWAVINKPAQFLENVKICLKYKGYCPFFRTSQSLNEASQQLTSPPPTNPLFPPLEQRGVVWTEADCHGMTNDGWLQFNYTLRVSLICAWVEINEAFHYRTQLAELWRFIFVIFQMQNWCVWGRTLLSLSLHPFVVWLYSMHISIVLAADYSR